MAPPETTTPTPAPDDGGSGPIEKKFPLFPGYPEEYDHSKVTVPDSIEPLGVGGCVDARGKFYDGVIAAGPNPKYTMYKPQPATEEMTLQRCLNILDIVSKKVENGKKGIKGLRGMKFGACNFAGGMGCVCHIIGDNGIQGQVKQMQIPGQPQWPDQCCNPGRGGCWPCNMPFPNNVGGGKGPIANQGGGFAGYCFKLKNSFG